MERLFSSVNIDDPEFLAKEQFLTAYHLVLALRQFAPHHKGGAGIAPLFADITKI